MKALFKLAWIGTGVGLALAATLAQAAATCQARSSVSPLVVELYTSEGCSSCPPADRWLSTLHGRSDVLPLAFHVNYWDRLGWPDRFASEEATRRQSLLARAAGAANVYTPQVVADGRDWSSWPKLPAAPAGPAAVELTIERDGAAVVVRASPRTDRPGAALAGYWAVVEDGHQSRVTAGENNGETLRHDSVVRLYRPIDAWPGSAAGSSRLTVTAGDPNFPRRVVFVVTDASSGKPLNAVALGC